MIVLGFDTSTPSTTVAVRLADGSIRQARDDPEPGTHPGHATRLLAMTAALLVEAGVGWRGLDRIAVGVGPGTFTGLRVGIATARGLAQSLSVSLVGVSSLRALAEGAARSCTDPILAVIDARRGQAFAAAYSAVASGSSGELSELVPARALAPEDLGSVVAHAEEPGGESGGPWLAIGDGAIRFRNQLEAAGVAVPADSSSLHLLDAAMICELGRRAPAAAACEEIVPDYRRRPDAELARDRIAALEGTGA